MNAKSVIVPPARVAVIGLGNMGVPMGACLVRASYSVAGFDAAESARQRFAASGGEVAGTLATAVSAADLVITILPNGKIVRDVVSAMRAHLRPGCVIVDMSSSDPVGTRTLGNELLRAKFEFADAPVSGGVKRAADGSLAIMVGGTTATIDRIQPVLSAMGRVIFRTGALGSGHAMKALNNYVSAAGLVAAVEAIAIGRKFGLDPVLMTDILNASSGRNNTTEVKLKPFILSETFNAGFPLRLMAKDVRTANDLAHAVGVAAPLADACADLWDAAARDLPEAADHTAVGRYLAKLPVRAASKRGP
ncbi:MAG: NAD(P)-dependent oxidoreductase [Alphaproteobacteria bacterium]|nr:NAD(P)-dependent oxidoreductase [Alphaproteobacteria bacterium]